MMQPELHQPSWSYHSNVAMDSPFDEVGFYGLDMGNCEFPSSFLSILEDSSAVSASNLYLSAEYYKDLEALSPIEQCLLSFEESVITSNEKPSFNEAFIDVSSAQQPSLVLPMEDMELDDQVSIPHLLKACGEAMENGNQELIGVILKRLEEKACPKGVPVQRLVYHLINSLNGNLDYLTQEASKNYELAFGAFYQMFPYGRFAHFIANSSILQALPEDTETIHVVDFDMGEGVQWPPLIEALGNQQRKRAVRIISVKHEDLNLPPLQSFEEAQKRLYEHASFCGMKLEVEEMDMERLAFEIQKTGGEREWFAFNCMVGLPHMGRWRSYRHVLEFLKIAQEFIDRSKSYRNCISDRGIVTFGDGCVVNEATSGCFRFGSFFECQMGRIMTLLESMELQLPLHFEEARMAMECLFVAPCVLSLARFEKLEERDCRDGILPKIELNAQKISKDSIAEVKELVREGDSLYWIRIEGENENQVVLCFLGNPLVRFCRWS